MPPVASNDHAADERVIAEAERRHSSFSNLLFGAPARLVGDDIALAPRLVMCSIGVTDSRYKRKNKRSGAPLGARTARRRIGVDGGGEDDGDEEYVNNADDVPQSKPPVQIIEIQDSQPSQQPSPQAPVPRTPSPPPVRDTDNLVPCERCGHLMPFGAAVACPACSPLDRPTSQPSSAAIAMHFSPSALEARWICGRCTFRNNTANRACEMCSGERSSEVQFVDEMARLRNLGVGFDPDECLSLLLRFSGDVERVANALLFNEFY